MSDDHCQHGEHEYGLVLGGGRQMTGVCTCAAGTVGQVARRGPRTTWLCGTCAREITDTHLKRHLAAHDRHGVEREVTNDEWTAYLKATGKWSVSTQHGGKVVPNE